MNRKGSQLLLIGVAAYISLLFTITTAHGASMVIGGNYIAIDRMIIVSPNPGDTPETNGTALRNILAGITGDQYNPYLVRLGPGDYDIGASSLQMNSYVNVEGSGVYVTRITGNPSSTDYCNAGATIISGVGNSLRSLTVRNIGASGTYAVGILSPSASHSPRITDVSVEVQSPGAIYNFGIVNCSGSQPEMLNVRVDALDAPGINRGLYNTSGSRPNMTNVHAYARGGLYADAIRNEDSGMSLRNGTAWGESGSLGSYGLSNAASASGPPWISVENSRIAGDTFAIFATSVYGGVSVAYSEIDGGVSSSGYISCIGAYNHVQVPLNNTCQ